MIDLPTGTVTFIFTDIEGSTQLWEQHPEAMKLALARHDAILKEAIESNHGYFIKTTGDGIHAVFATALDAVNSSISAQRMLNEMTSEILKTSEAWPLRVRMGLHTGEAELRDGDYYGQSLNRTARIMSIGHGRQILLSAITADLVREQLSANTSLLDLGEHYLKGLTHAERICQLVSTGLQKDFPPLNSISIAKNNLPTQLTSFIGREKEIAEIKAMLNVARLITLTGSGGTGKTRLSIEVGTQEFANFANGVWLIELAPLVDPAQIIPALAQTFGLQELPFNPLENLVIDYLRGKKLLLILDNCEHLIEACARLANDLLHQCAGLKILASSREALGIAGEMTYHTPSLAEFASTRLFVERARAVNPKFSLTDSNSSSIAQICSRLDGIPLAIELAAARAKLLSPEQIAVRLDDRFRLLVGGSRTALPRQQTLRALIDWSYDLLSEEERLLLRTASVFVGGWTLDAIEAVSNDPNTIEHLEQLVNKSLVLTEERRSEMRYSMLETIRQYAREKLFDAKQASAARDRHFVYFDELAEKLWDMFRSPNALAWRDKVDDELENMRAALEWGMEHDVEAALHLGANFCIVSGSLTNATEALGLLKSALDQVRSLELVEGEANIARQKLIASALFAQGLVGMGGAGFPEIAQSFQEAISISRVTGDKRTLGYSLELYFIASRFNEVSDGTAAAEEGLAILSEIKDWWGMGMAYMNMVTISSVRGALDEKQKYLEIVKERLQNAPMSVQLGMFYLILGFDELRQDNHELAKQYFENGLFIFRRLGNKNFEYIMRSELGHLARLKRDFTQAKEIYKQTIQGWQELGARPAIAHQLECFAAIAMVEEEPQRAAKLFATGDALREKSQSPMSDHEQIEYDQLVAELRTLLNESDFNAFWAEGCAMTMEQAIQFALQ